MTTQALPLRESRLDKLRKRWQEKRWQFRNYVKPVVRNKAKAYWQQATANFYTIAGLVSFVTAGFIHSVFSGFIVMGVCWFALELKTRGT